MVRQKCSKFLDFYLEMIKVLGVNLEMFIVFRCLFRNGQIFLGGLLEMIKVSQIEMFNVFWQFTRSAQSFQVFILEMIKIFRCLSRNVQSLLGRQIEMFKVFRWLRFKVLGVYIENFKNFRCLSRNDQSFLGGQVEMFKVFRQFFRNVQSIQVFILEMIKLFR